MNNLNISFIGAGNMANCIIGGLIAHGVPNKNIFASDPNTQNLNKVVQSYGVTAAHTNDAAVEQSDVVILAVKPQVMREVCIELKKYIPVGTLVISIAAGISCNSLARWLGDDRAIVRCMPNTPALVAEGASALFANAATSEQQKEIANNILSAVGTVSWVNEEELIDAVTAVSGSGPAYFFLVMEAMIDAGVQQGLARETAESLAIQTALGAARLAKQSDVDVGELRRRVTSPNGTTERAIAAFEEHKLRDIFAIAMNACADRSRELALELGSDIEL